MSLIQSIKERMKDVMSPAVTSIRLANEKDSFSLSELDISVAYNDHFESPCMAHWSQDIFEVMMKEAGNEIFVAKSMLRTVGYMAVHLSKRENAVIIQRMAVDPLYRRRGVGTELICNLIQECYFGGVSSVHCLVPERYVDFQCFLRSNKFRVTGIVRSEFYNGDDSYTFSARLP